MGSLILRFSAILLSREEAVLVDRPYVITTGLHLSKPNGANIIWILEAWLVSEVKWSEVKWSAKKWVTVKSLGTKVPCTLGWPYTECTWMYCDYFIWCVTCTVVILTCFVMCGWFGTMCICIYSVLYCWYCVFVLFRLCTFTLFCWVTTQLQ